VSGTSLQKPVLLLLSRALSLSKKDIGMIPRVKGTHDILDTGLLDYFLSIAKRHLEQYAFCQIVTPILEHTELFRRSLGLETDVVSKEMFTITAANSPESLCLRPEATASIMRAFLEHGQLPQPWKVYLYGPMFRHERPQKGRFRQFHQISAEMIGTDSPAQDVLFIAMLDRLFQKKLSIAHYALLINFLGCPQDRIQFRALLRIFLDKQGSAICQNCQVRKEHNILRIFDCKNESCQEIYTKAPHIAEHLCSGCKQEWEWIQEQLLLLSVPFSYKPSLVRGLDYYDKIVFEFVSPDLGAQAAFCGGGRYNHLATQLGAKDEIPAIGMAIGVERVLILLELQKESLSLPPAAALNLILPLSPGQYPLALLLADTLHTQGLVVDVLTSDASLKSMLKAANKRGASFALLLGEEEQKAGTVTVRHLLTHQQETVCQIKAVEYIKMRL